MPSQKFGAEITRMHVKLTQADQESNLPPLHLDLAGRKKGESERMILEKAIADSSRILGVYIRPKATPGHVITVKTFKYTGDQQYEVGHGVLAFSLIPPGVVSTAARKQAAEDQCWPIRPLHSVPVPH